MKAAEVAILQQNLARARGEPVPEPAVPLRRNRSNTGKPFEKLIESALDRYEVLGIMRVRKVDPPVKFVNGRMILTRNPFLDYLGVWQERKGRALFFEAKSTSTPTLPVNREVGLKSRQCESLREWSRAGAVCFVLWQYRREVCLIPAETIMILEVTGENLRWSDHGIPVPEHGWGWPNFIDVLRTMALP